MKKLSNLIFIFFLFNSITLPAQKKTQDKTLFPPGFTYVQKRLLVVSINEITVSNWMDFMDEKGLDYAPDANAINDKCVCERSPFREPVMKSRNIVYRDTSYHEIKKGKKGKLRNVKIMCGNMPITGITFAQAQAYCNWLSEKYKKDEKYSALGLNFRLPEMDEMDSLLTDALTDWPPYQEVYRKGINEHGCALYNHAHNSWCDNNLNLKYSRGYRVPIEVGYFFADGNGLYDLMGNVAEMTSVDQQAKGGSCEDVSADCQPGAINQYGSQHSWLGFRVVASY